MTHICITETEKIDVSNWTSREFALLNEHCKCDHKVLSNGINKWIAQGKPNSDTPNWKLAIKLYELGEN